MNQELIILDQLNENWRKKLYMLSRKYHTYANGMMFQIGEMQDFSDKLDDYLILETQYFEENYIKNGENDAVIRRMLNVFENLNAAIGEENEKWGFNSNMPSKLNQSFLFPNYVELFTYYEGYMRFASTFIFGEVNDPKKTPSIFQISNNFFKEFKAFTIEDSDKWKIEFDKIRRKRNKLSHIDEINHSNSVFENDVSKKKVIKIEIIENDDIKRIVASIGSFLELLQKLLNAKKHKS